MQVQVTPTHNKQRPFKPVLAGVVVNLVVSPSILGCRAVGEGGAGPSLLSDTRHRSILNSIGVRMRLIKINSY